MRTRLQAAFLLLGTVLGISATPANAALVISKGPTQNVNCSAGVCTATAADAVLNVKDVKKFLRAGDLKIVSGSAAQDIDFAVKLQWTKPTRLTLDAFRSITFHEAVTVEGAGAVTLITNDGGTGGNHSFAGKGHITFWDLSSNLAINGNSYALVGDVKSLAAGIAAHPSRNYALARFYDASVDGTYADSPIITPFNGKFDGLGHAIANLSLTIRRKTTVEFGLFLKLGAQAVVRNIELQDFNYAYEVNLKRPIYHHAGMLAAENAGRIKDVVVTGGIISSGYGGCSGGIVGSNSGTVLNSAVQSVDVVGQGTGGIACGNTGLITQSHVNATVEGGFASAAGGIAESNEGTISLSYSMGTVAVEGDDGFLGDNGEADAGGVAVDNYGLVDRCFSLASVDGGGSSAGQEHESNSWAGGLIAKNYGEVLNSYEMGSVIDADLFGVGVYVGGAIGEGYSGSEVTGTYSTGAISCPDCRGDIAGFIGVALASASADYWNVNTTGESSGCGYGDCEGVAGLTTSQFKSGLPAGFDPAVWGQSTNINNGYPYLLANPPRQ